MNNIFGQPTNCCGRQQSSYRRPCPRPQPAQCNQLPGTIFRINIPAGAEINILNLLELTSPTGICLILRLPFLGGECGQDVSQLFNQIRRAGGTVEPFNN